MSSVSVALAMSRPQTPAIQPSRPLLSVMTWEFRRYRASRLFWFQALGFFCLVLFVTWSVRQPGQPLALAHSQGTMTGFIAGTSAWGLLTSSLPTGALFLLALLVPFVTADGVSRDLSRRTHEVLMATAVPSWAYVWGRYLIGLLMSLSLAGLALAATLVTGMLLHLSLPAYPLPPIGAVVFLWCGIALPATVLVISLSFALGTVFPRQSTLIKIGIIAVWFMGAVILPSGFDQTNLPPAWYSNWDPTSVTTAQGLLPQYAVDFANQASSATSEVRFQQILLAVENKVPDAAGWFLPHLLVAGLSLLLVALAAYTFQRFRAALN